ncbi:MAG: hypothetical protein DRO67_04570 [Candidatus Asgardarchaeum californiense]|nr:MAG: hypothetical protein DRO67_04570 [Candidatus Asgardarchaeum californiense]
MIVTIPNVSVDHLESIETKYLVDCSDSTLASMYNRAIKRMERRQEISDRLCYVCGKIFAILESRTMVEIVNRQLHLK